ncbi:MAG: bifunctional protein-serine/threonine kinase/phosphatase [Limnobacter sp.]|uniref:bifunctional protein-serine/threonine kinase/phosphatase n=1 Tax=Limnobacter sp. TaxID=2003368 RepID=UPI0032EB76B6
MSSTLQVRFGGYSIAGQKPVNQDAFAAWCGHAESNLLKGAAAAIADGVSSCADSHVASQTAVTSFLDDYSSTPYTWSVHKSARQIISGLNAWIYQQNTNRASHNDSLLTTFSAVVLKSNTLHCFHVGDSRIYHVRGDAIERLTQDHVRTERGQEYLSRALGADRHLELDYSTHELQVGDLVLLSTDGVHGVLKRPEMLGLIAEHGTTNLELLAQSMVQAALNAGSDDNLTVLLMAVDTLPHETLDEVHRKLTQLPIPPVLQVGNKIDGYEVQEIIFSGTRSHMYRVRDMETGEQFTLKTPSLNFAEDAMYLNGFVREEWVGQSVQHVNVMRTHVPKRPKQFLYYLGEYIEGINLREWMYDNPKPGMDAVRRIVKQVVAGLRAFQRADMVHQDIKPENIMIDSTGCVKILDFGTVLIAGADELISPLDKSVPQGSVNYVAPEYLMGEVGTFKSDLFSLGVVVYEMLTGALPFAEKSVKQVTLKSYSDLRYIPANHPRRDLPLWVEACLRKALQPNPRYRYDALSEFLQDLTVPNTKLEASVARQPLIEKNPVVIWQVLAVVLLVLNLIQLVFR